MEKRYNGKDANLERLSETNISDSALGLVVQVGYHETKGLIAKGSYEVLCSQLDVWFERCPELKDVVALWIESAYQCDNPTEGRLKRKLLRRVTFHDFCGILARVRVKSCATIPFFMKSLLEAILSESAVLYCATNSLDTLCDGYFAEIEEFMEYAEED